MKNLVLLIFLAFGLIGFSQNQWVIKDSINGAPRSAAVSFVLNGEGFTVAGLDESGFRRKMYSYTYWQDDWDDEISMGGVNGSGLSRGSACAFSIQNQGYVCLGQGETNPFFKDLWEYDLATGAWTQKADFIGSPRRSAVAFTINDEAYVGTGQDASGFKKDMYKYSSFTNSWTQVSDFQGTARKDAVGFTIGSQGYIGTGDDGVLKNDFWQYNPSTDLWLQKADFPGTKRRGATAWGIFPQGWICTGEDINSNYTNDLWEYNYFTNNWVQRAPFLGEGRTEAIAFVIQEVAFVGSGFNGEFLDDLYAYRRIVGLEEVNDYSTLEIYPNPVRSFFNIKVNTTGLKVEIFSLSGQNVTDKVQIENTSEGFIVYKNELSSGNYFISLRHTKQGSVHQSKFIIL